MRILCAVDGSEHSQWGIQALEALRAENLNRSSCSMSLTSRPCKHSSERIPSASVAFWRPWKRPAVFSFGMRRDRPAWPSVRPPRHRAQTSGPSWPMAVFFGYDLYGEHDVHLADAADYSQGDFVLMAIKHEVETPGTDGEVPNLDSLQERRQRRTDETHQTLRCIDS